MMSVVGAFPCVSLVGRIDNVAHGYRAQASLGAWPSFHLGAAGVVVVVSCLSLFADIPKPE